MKKITYLFLGKRQNSDSTSNYYIKRREDHLSTNILPNRSQAVSLLRANVSNFCILNQMHSNKVKIVTDFFPLDQEPEADALVTNKTSLPIAVITADCVPILLADEKNNVIAAIHAGWRGAKSDIISNTINAMKTLGARPSEIVAYIGPCIRQKSYEVGDEFFAEFLAEDQANKKFFISALRAEHYFFDLAGYVKEKLSSQMISNIIDCGIDTFSDEEYFSYRRDILNKIPYRYNNLAIIMIEPL